MDPQDMREKFLRIFRPVCPESPELILDLLKLLDYSKHWFLMKCVVGLGNRVSLRKTNQGFGTNLCRL